MTSLYFKLDCWAISHFYLRFKMVERVSAISLAAANLLMLLSCCRMHLVDDSYLDYFHLVFDTRTEVAGYYGFHSRHQLQVACVNDPEDSPF